LGLTLLLAASVGSVAITASEVAAAIGRGVQIGLHELTGGRVAAPGDVAGTAAGGMSDVIIWQIRLPRVLLAALVGAALALAGAGFQGVFRNPLADPYLLGAASGAGFGASLAIVSGLAGVLGAVAVPLAAFVSSALTVALVINLARRGWTLPVVPLLLAGVVLGSVLAAATSFVLLASRAQATGVLTWLLGSLSFASWTRVATLALPVLVAVVVGLLHARALDVLQLGERSAAQLGVRVEWLKLSVIAASTLVTAAAVSVAGVIGFVGLVVPHAVRLLFGPDHRRLLPLSLVWGAMFMVAADLVARTLIAPAELPVGIVTAVVGAPFFLFLLRRRSDA
jgi:iron complex transport system permease protein